MEKYPGNSNDSQFHSGLICAVSRYINVLALLFGMTSGFANEQDVYGLKLEELLNTPVEAPSKKAHTQVTLASKKAQSLAQTPAAIYVITHDDIKRSGATNLPDVLRMAPGLEVARIDSNKWAVSARGFNGRFANKLLVLIDGRNTYTQTFSGVYWETQDVLLEDIDRIEIIRGPGAALWGANAVNGVINVITKHSADTQNTEITAGGGTYEQGFGSVRYGTALGKDTTGRVYLKGSNRGEFTHLDGSGADDQWNKIQGGFRVDSLLSEKDAVTVLGDLYTSTLHQLTSIPSLTAPDYVENLHEKIQAYGGNVLTRLQHTLSADSDFTLQAYYSAYNRDEIIDHELRQTADIDIQHHFAWLDWHDLVWGLNYRYSNTQNHGSRPEIVAFLPPTRTDHYFSAFIQDEMTLIDKSLWLTLGSKFEHNAYSGFEFQPTIRLLGSPLPKHYLWTAISRAVRTPSTAEANVNYTAGIVAPNNATNPTPFPIQAVLTGNAAFTAEELLAYEIGYRTNMFKAVSFDITGFYNQYHALRSIVPDSLSFNGVAIVQPLCYANNNSGATYGFETSITWQQMENWRWELNYSFLKADLKETRQEFTAPQHKISLRSSINPIAKVTMDAWLRYTDQSAVPYASNFVSQFPIPQYLTLDIRLAWQLSKQIELSLTGQNLLDQRHLEFVQEAVTLPTEIDRSFYGKIVWQF